MYQESRYKATWKGNSNTHGTMPARLFISVISRMQIRYISEMRYSETSLLPIDQLVVNKQVSLYLDSVERGVASQHCPQLWQL